MPPPYRPKLGHAGARSIRTEDIVTQQRVGSAHADAAQSRVRTLAWLLVVVIAVGAGASITHAISDRAWGFAGGSNHDAGHAVGDVVPVAFGTLRVSDVSQVDGVTHRALSGSTHGVKSYVDGAHATVQTTLRISNTTDRVHVWQVNQFRLRVTRDGRTTLRRPDGGNLPDTLLAAHSGLAGHLDFTIQRKVARLALVFTPSAHAGPIVIELGRAAFDARAPGGHEH